MPMPPCLRSAAVHEPPEEPTEIPQVLRELLDDPARRGEQHLEQPDPEEDQQEVRVQAPVGLEEERQHWMNSPGDDRAPEAEDAAR